MLFSGALPSSAIPEEAARTVGTLDVRCDAVRTSDVEVLEESTQQRVDATDWGSVLESEGATSGYREKRKSNSYVPEATIERWVLLI